MITTEADRKSDVKVYGMVAAAMMCAVTAILSQIMIPMPSGVPVTLQTFAVALCGFVLTVRYSLASILVYILLGAVGLPVFSGFSGGPGKLFGLTGGFIWGFVFFALLCSLSLRIQNMILRFFIAILGLAICHLLGVLQFAFLSENGVLSAFLLVSAPYLIKDFISLVLAYLIAGRIRPILRKRMA